ncbi:intraflagellar transport protein 81 homolog isoform X2 [Euwallacea fornicatus]|uniref:intraflagellar transport protein 81 homolog isoform X2 n=1 Tax=Euwallacea fornicatus TaxID=995702 RepID=UPI00339016B2
MHSHSPDQEIDMDEIAKELDEIDSRYTHKINRKCTKIPISLHESLAVLSKEFDSLGLSPINLEKTMPEILEEVVTFSRDLVQIHRNTINLVKDKNIQTVNTIDKYKSSLETLKNSCMALKNRKADLVREINEFKQREKRNKEQIECLKRMYNGKEKLLEHNVTKMQMEIERLREICGKDIVSETTTNEIALTLLKKHKANEEIYKSTIKTLQEDTKLLLDEILYLKEEMVLCKAD